jgi:hypothetical protein
MTQGDLVPAGLQADQVQAGTTGYLEQFARDPALRLPPRTCPMAQARQVANAPSAPVPEFDISVSPISTSADQRAGDLLRKDARNLIAGVPH